MKYSKTACKIVIAPPQCGETFAEMEISSSVSVFLGQKSALKEISFFQQMLQNYEKVTKHEKWERGQNFKRIFYIQKLVNAEEEEHVDDGDD